MYSPTKSSNYNLMRRWGKHTQLCWNQQVSRFLMLDTLLGVKSVTILWHTIIYHPVVPVSFFQTCWQQNKNNSLISHNVVCPPNDFPPGITLICQIRKIPPVKLTRDTCQYSTIGRDSAWKYRSYLHND